MNRTHNSVTHKNKLNLFRIIILLAFFVGHNGLFAQMNASSPASWLFPDGNTMGTKQQLISSQAQEIDSFKVKWTSPDISGDVVPLIGNVINNPKISPRFTYAPNEIAAVMGGKLIVLDAGGRTHRKTDLPPFVKNLSMMFDSSSTIISSGINRSLIMGLETIEHENQEDKLAYAYVAGFDHDADSVAILKRLAVNLTDYAPNFHASIKPVFGRRHNDEVFIYATVNMSDPTIDDSKQIPFYRGFAQFNTGTLLSTYPLPDIGEESNSRMTIAHEINFAQPSCININNEPNIIFPSKVDLGIVSTIFSGGNVTPPTNGDNLTLISVKAHDTQIEEQIFNDGLNDEFYGTGDASNKPRFRSYYVNITDPRDPTQDSVYVLVAEEYSGIDGSDGYAQLHIFDDNTGVNETIKGVSNKEPFRGGMNHFWSIATGNVDGNASNAWDPWYPNNTGNEIIATQSTRDFAYPGSKLFILKFDTRELEKPSPPGETLRYFDTICSQHISGWVAAVNDLDNAPDNKDEIVLVEGSILRIMRLKDYQDYDFRLGKVLDTVATYSFKQQTISNVAVADMEGDGLNDLIVTTYDSTYVIGTVITDILTMVTPLDGQWFPTDYCAGDTVHMKWINYMRGQDLVNIRFVEEIGGIPTGDTLMVLENLDNTQDTVEFNYVVGDVVFDRQGRFLVESAYNPRAIFDTTMFVNITGPGVILDPLDKNEYTLAEDILFSGTSECADTIIVEVMYQDSVWQEVEKAEIYWDNTFNFTAQLPSSTMFQCIGEDLDSMAYIRLISYRYDFRDTSAIMPIKLRPAPFPVTWEPCTTACPTKRFEWNMMDFPFACDSVYISASLDYGETFTLLAALDANDEQFEWLVPLETPDSLIMRFCCGIGDTRTDTLIYNYKPKYIEIIAPNPFRALQEEMEIVYKVPESTNVTIRIYDASNRLVAMPVKNASRQKGTAYCDKWDGRLPNGAAAASGMYYLSFELSNGDKQIYHVFVRR